MDTFPYSFSSLLTIPTVITYSSVIIMQSDQSTVRSTFNSESIDESVTNCHMFGYNKQRIRKFLCCVIPVSYAMHCKSQNFVAAILLSMIIRYQQAEFEILAWPTIVLKGAEM
jgi:hypothetical protein